MILPKIVFDKKDFTDIRTTFNISLTEKPEKLKYSQNECSTLKYNTKSLTARGPIDKINIVYIFNICLFILLSIILILLGSDKIDYKRGRNFINTLIFLTFIIFFGLHYYIGKIKETQKCCAFTRIITVIIIRQLT